MRRRHIIILAEHSRDGVAVIQRDTDLTLESDYVWGTCDLFITEDEPYSHMSSPCKLYKDDLAIIGHNIVSYVLGWPRSAPLSKVWPLLSPSVPQANVTYCASFGYLWAEYDLTMYFGHHSNSNQNLIKQGHATCKTAVPQVKAYYQTQCVGGFVWVWSLDSLIPGVHFSYRKVIDPLFCWAFATFPDN
ncbi:MAG: hypothetical protein ACREQV_11285 [Candidatus Binatia bacterium]